MSLGDTLLNFPKVAPTRTTLISAGPWARDSWLYSTSSRPTPFSIRTLVIVKGSVLWQVSS